MIVRQQSVDPARPAGTFFPFRATSRAALRPRAERMLSCRPMQRLRLDPVGLRGPSHDD